MSEFNEIIQGEFLCNPTDTTIAVMQFEEIANAANSALERDDMEQYWELSMQMRLAGKFLPTDDLRNPDNPIYNGPRQQR